MNIVNPEEELLVVSENGFGKRTLVSEYSIQHRGGKGVITYKVSEKTGKLVGAKMVKDGDEIILINSNGIVIRLNVSGISTTSRNTMGVTLMKNGEGDDIVAIAKINQEDIEDDIDENDDLIHRRMKNIDENILETANDKLDDIEEDVKIGDKQVLV